MVYFAIYRYRANLIEAKKFGIRMGIISAIGIGLIFFIMFCAYALAFWYGSKLVREGEMTAGNMITVRTPTVGQSVTAVHEPRHIGESYVPIRGTV